MLRTIPLLLALVGMMVALSCGSKRAAIRSTAPPTRATPYHPTFPTWANDTSYAPMFPDDNPMTVEGVALGRKLFYEEALSRDGTLSCGSCHMQKHAFSDTRRHSVGTDGASGHRNAMALMNLAWSHFYFWDARALSLEAQALAPVTDHRELFNAWPEVVQRLRERTAYAELFQAAFGTMEIDSTHIARALAQFERTIISFNSRFDHFHYECDTLALTPTEQRGMDLFFGDAHCDDCHELPLFQDHGVINIGLDSIPVDQGMGARTGIAKHIGRFKTPSLRNCAVSAPYMHDGRFATLEQVIDFYADDVQLNTPNFDDHMFAWKVGVVQLDNQERADLVAFLKSLTDTTFLNDPSLSDPDMAGR
ncbi:MAG: c-type cytochrome [Flavobacteriales bacterium]|nr:c-type cytochrome [Flavobacteriales bacterium]